MPETGDTDFSWREFFRRNNDELVATYGNLVHRVLTFTYRNFNGCVPGYTNIDAASKELEARAHTLLSDVGNLITGCHFKQAIMVAMSLAHDTNRYLDEKSPWKLIKNDKPAAGDSLYVALQVISGLKTMLYPFLPFSSQKLHELLGFKGKIQDKGWQLQILPPGQKLLLPRPLFSKLDEELVGEETKRLGHIHSG
jgi:methionyl-tRNA synthetase